MSINNNVDMKMGFLNQILQCTGGLVSATMNNITQGVNSVWDVDNSSNTQIPAETETEAVPEPLETPKKNDDEIKQEVLDILQNNPNVKVDFKSEGGKLILEAAVKKYDAMKAVNPKITAAEVSRRLSNYVNGYIYHTGENFFGVQSLGEAIGVDSGYSNHELVNPDIKDAVNKGDTDAYKEAFHQQAKEYIEFYDETGDGKIDLAELIMSEVNETQTEMKRNLTKDEKSAIKEMAMTKIATLDKNGDNKLDENEISGYHWARNNLHGKGYNMTYQEYDEFETALYGWQDLTPEQIEKGNQCDTVLKKHNLKVGSLNQDLSTYGFTPQEYKIVSEGLEFLKVSVAHQAYDNGYEGLKQ